MLGDAQSILGKMVSSILIFLSISIFWLFCFVIFHATKQLPASTGAPKIGQNAPEFALRDTRKTWFRLQPFYSLRSICQIHPGAPQKECFSSFIAAIADRCATPSYGVFRNS
jgi:hypothetical protein